MKTVDAEKHAAFIIAKVFEFGTWNDLLAVARHYGLPKLKEVAMNATGFFPDTAGFLSVILNVSKDQIPCFTPKRFRPNASN